MLWFVLGVLVIFGMVVIATKTPPETDECLHCGLTDDLHDPTGTFYCPICKRRGSSL